jgi:hypothetical protein
MPMNSSRWESPTLQARRWAVKRPIVDPPARDAQRWPIPNQHAIRLGIIQGLLRRFAKPERVRTAHYAAHHQELGDANLPSDSANDWRSLDASSLARWQDPVASPLCIRDFNGLQSTLGLHTPRKRLDMEWEDGSF